MCFSLCFRQGQDRSMYEAKFFQELWKEKVVRCGLSPPVVKGRDVPPLKCRFQVCHCTVYTLTYQVYTVQRWTPSLPISPLTVPSDPPQLHTCPCQLLQTSSWPPLLSNASTAHCWWSFMWTIKFVLVNYGQAPQTWIHEHIWTRL